MSAPFAVSDPHTARRLYESVCAEAAALAEEGEAEMSLRLVALAGYLGWYFPNGLASDPRLEAVIRQIASALPRVEAAPGSAKRTLHVLTEAYATGGHSRFAWRWIERSGEAVDLVLTGRLSEEIPAGLRQAVEAVGGTIHVLERSHGSLLERAQALAVLVAAADHVVLHVHPFDPIAFLALECAAVRPPVIFENHADHAFWLGVGWSDVVTNHRVQGAQVCREWRGVEPSRLVIVPVPVDPVVEGLRRKARKALGIAPQARTALCIGSAAKLSPHFGVDFLASIHQVLQENPALVLVVVGPGEASAWGQLVDLHPGRVTVYGQVADLSPYLAAADFAIDSSPVSGGTTVLEEAIAGLGTVCLQEVAHYSPIWASQSPGLEGLSVVCANVAELSAEVAQMIDDVAYCQDLGQRSRHSVKQHHAGDGWLEYVAQARDAAVAAGPAIASSAAEEMEHRYLEELWDFTRGASSAPISGLLGDPFGLGVSLEAACAILGGWFGPDPVRVLLQSQWVEAPEVVEALIRLTSTHRDSFTVVLPVEAEQAERGIGVVLAVIEALGLDQENCGQIELLGAAEAADEDAVVLPASLAGIAALTRLVSRLRPAAPLPAV